MLLDRSVYFADVRLRFMPERRRKQDGVLIIQERTNGFFDCKSRNTLLAA